MGDVLTTTTSKKTYADCLTDSMTWLGQMPDTIFIGQSVEYPGNAIFKTLCSVPAEKKLELPVAEDMQMGMSIGLAMTGKTVISIFPRMDFLMCAMNQLVNHLDKNIYPLKGKVIIRTCVGSKTPMNPGVQHCGDYTDGLMKILHNIVIMEFSHPTQIMRAYKDAYIFPGSTLLIEYGDLYGMV